MRCRYVPLSQTYCRPARITFFSLSNIPVCAPPKPSIFDSNVRFRGHFGPLWASFWSFLGPKWAREPQKAGGGGQNWAKRAGPHGGRVFDIPAAVHGKVGQMGRQNVKIRFLVLARNALKMSFKWSETVPQHVTMAAFGGRGAFGAAPVAVAAYVGQITHPQTRCIDS